MSHYEAVKERLEGDAALADKVFDTSRINADGELIRANYLILYGGSPAELGGDRLFKQQVQGDNGVFDFTVRGVGVTATSARTMLAAASAQLVNWIPEIAGRNCRPMKFTGGGDIRTDTSVKPPLYYADDEYELRSFFTSEGS